MVFDPAGIHALVLVLADSGLSEMIVQDAENSLWLLTS